MGVSMGGKRACLLEWSEKEKEHPLCFSSSAPGKGRSGVIIGF